MKWVKHDTDANQDAKLQNVLLDYGLEGYGLYWYCIELIASGIDTDNITFELEHDARIIARNTGSTPQKVEEMMRYFVKERLFESIDGVITCFKLAKRLDKSMTSNPQMREIIGKLKNHDSIMTQSEKPMQDKIRLDKTREDNKTPLVQPKVKQKKASYSDYHLAFAKWMHSLILNINPNAKEPNFESWANTIRLMIDIDKRDGDEMVKVFQWANQDSFWNSNILSADKFRKQYDQLSVKSRQEDIAIKVANNERTQDEVDQFTAELNDQFERSQAAKQRREARSMK
jgi:hypothetical protein